MVSVDITLPDRSTSTVSLFPAAGAEKPLVVIWPGFGMGARYYTPIASWLSDNGFPSAIGELRGQGTSTARASRSRTWGYHTLVTEDYPLTISAAKEVLGLSAGHPVALLTHSMGGQVGMLYLSSARAREQNVVGMMGVGTGSPYWKSFTGRSKRRIGMGAPVMAGVSRTLGFWPAGKWDLAGYGRQAGRHVREWAQLSRSNSIGHIAGADYPTAVSGVQVPVLLTRFGNDEDCTIASAEALAQHAPAAELAVEQLDGGLGHNKWARDPEVVGRRFVRFYEEKLA
ncbi:alpha/beta fold hydrolase [Corynebacterium timonense]|uniref:Predicted alpha/beta hydrolase n=1 Tax=Corynebacterium timonense TaxID=441500 RepID=A0A1H1UBB2_9CORY|nr:alpha/beta fold hydrolase [Corynebacterium timonense]SDS69757.1 Predicted alpha/beta hydrolase [Corynebacterium timonense]